MGFQADYAAEYSMEGDYRMNVLHRVLQTVLLVTTVVLVACNQAALPTATPTPQEYMVEQPIETVRSVTEANIKLLLSEGSVSERINAAYAAPHLNVALPEILPFLIANLQYDGPYEVRQHTALSLGEIGPEAVNAVSELVRVLGEDFVHVRRAAARALGQIGHPSAVPPLVAALYPENEEDTGVQLDAAEAIEAIIGVDFSDSPRGTLNEQGESLAAVAAKRWWENMGQFQDWPEMP